MGNPERSATTVPMSADMKFLRLYLRVLELLGREARLGWMLAFANLALASAMFVEPILFGRIIDTLANAQAASRSSTGSDLCCCSAPGSASRCSPSSAARWSRCTPTGSRTASTRWCEPMFFEHVLQLPLSYHTGAHSGRLVKVMMTGTNTLWGLWLAFFREHFASFVSLLVLLPLTLFINWRYGLLLIVLCVIFAVLIALVVSQERDAAEQGRALLQRRRRAHHRHARQHRAGAELRPHRERSARA